MIQSKCFSKELKQVDLYTIYTTQFVLCEVGTENAGFIIMLSGVVC